MFCGAWHWRGRSSALVLADLLVPLASCVALCLPALVAEELPCVKEAHNSAVGFGGGAGLNGRSASFTVPLFFFGGIVVTHFCCLYSGLAICWIKRNHSEYVSLYCLPFFWKERPVFVSQLSRPLSGDVVNWGWGRSKLKIHI